MQGSPELSFGCLFCGLKEFGVMKRGESISSCHVPASHRVCERENKWAEAAGINELLISSLL